MNIKNNIVVSIYGLMMLATLVIPAIFMGIFELSSMAAGAGLVSVSYILILVTYAPHYSLLENKRGGILLLISFFIVIFFQGVMGYFTDNFDYQRYLKSFILLIIYFSGSYCLVRLSQNLNNSITDSAVSFAFYVMLLSGIFGILKYSPFYNEVASKAVFFYSEPSHFSLNFLPLLLYVIIRGSSNTKILFLILGMMITIILENLTLLVGVFLVLFIAFPIRWLPYISFFCVASLGIFGVDYYIDRLNFFGESSNLSVLVYMQGWERAYLNFFNTNGLGVGFQQFGIIGDIGEISDKIEFLSGQRLNIFDGGSVSTKLIGEFGAVGLLIISVYLRYFCKFVKILHKYSITKVSIEDYKEILYLSFFVMYSIDLFVRGVGYFSSSGFLFLASIIWLILNNKFNPILPSKLDSSNINA